jgi:hypothetical protein
LDAGLVKFEITGIWETMGGIQKALGEIYCGKMTDILFYIIYI